MVGVVAGLAAYGIYRYTRAYFDKCSKQCGTYTINNTKRQLCMLNCKKLQLQKEIELMRKNKIENEKIIKKANQLNVINKKIILYKQYIKDHPGKIRNEIRINK